MVMALAMAMAMINLNRWVWRLVVQDLCLHLGKIFNLTKAVECRQLPEPSCLIGGS